MTESAIATAKQEFSPPRRKKWNLGRKNIKFLASTILILRTEKRFIPLQGFLDFFLRYMERRKRMLFKNSSLCPEEN